MATTTQHINAKADQDLGARLVAQAEMMEIPNASSWVYSNLPALISTEVSAGQSIADVHAYASTVRENYIAATPPPAGADDTIITDAYLAAAITAVQAAQ